MSASETPETKKQRWISLVRYDPEISSIANQLRPFGERWIDELERAFFSLNEDRSYLPHILERLLLEADKSIELAWFEKFSLTQTGEATTSRSFEILTRAAQAGFVLTVTHNHTITVQKTGVGSSYLYSNSDIEQFGEFHDL